MITDPAIEEYLERLQRPGDGVLLDMEQRGREDGFPIVGPVVGRILMQYALAIGARKVFEMGSGFGYSTYWFARAVGREGRVVHTDGDSALSTEARQWLHKGGLRDRVHFEVGDAVSLLDNQQGPFDVVFIDVDKHAYTAAWRAARDKVRPGGLILADNILWQGKVVEETDDQWTRAVQQYTQLAATDPQFVTTILPVRDGVAVSLRLPDATA